MARLLPVIGLVAALAVAAALPRSAVQAFDLVGYAICHRIPERSFFVGGTQLPLCARDTGTFSSALLTLVLFTATTRGRPARFPRLPYILFLGTFALAWAADGFNSYVALVTGQPLVYPPQNWLRLLTGAGMGSALAVLLVVLFNQTTWQTPSPVAPIERPIDLWRVAVGIALTLGAYLWRPDFLYAPLAALSGIGAVALLSVVNSLIVMVVQRRHTCAVALRDLALPMALGVLLAAVEIGGIAGLRLALIGPVFIP
ncbi:MAG: DUF2085 domain-containing protein [Thermoflexales bacterium]|nr:DUF2085 domain-containing protein [Thermoflexales bacterium]